MSPWNYPFLLTMEPISDAIAAGNTIIVKPSAYSPATSEIIKKIIEECFPPEYIAVVTGGREENKELLNSEVTVCGWVRTSRDSKNMAFIELNDGTSFKHLQIVIDNRGTLSYPW